MGLEIGFDERSTAVFEGQFLRGQILSPSPFFTNCELTLSSAAQSLEEYKNLIVTGIFREDSFDPVSRIRRGRVYVEGNQQPLEWNVSINPVRTPLKTYFNYSLIRNFHRDTWSQLVLFLGEGEYRKAWKVVDVEPISTGEELFTIKSMSFFSFLPALKKSADTEYLNTSVNKLVDAMHRDAPESIIDLCRDTATYALGVHLDMDEKDLGALLKELNKLPTDKQKSLAFYSANIINRLHPRRKPNEQKKHKLRDLCPEDAQLAVQCLGNLLVELGYASY